LKWNKRGRGREESQGGERGGEEKREQRRESAPHV